MRKPAHPNCRPRPIWQGIAGLIFLLLTVLTAAAQPSRLGDLDADGRLTILDVVRLLRHYNQTASLPAGEAIFADLNQDGAVNEQDAAILKEVILGRLPAPELPLLRARSTSPAAGESDVAVTRETVFYLTLPLEANTAITTQTLYGTFGGRKILSRVELSSDRKTVTLFYLEPLPPGARIRVTFKGDALRDSTGRGADLDGDGQAGGTLEFDFATLSTTAIAGTVASGRVFASELALSAAADGQLVNRPLAGVTITVDGQEETMRAVTDATGNFRLDPAPAGPFFVHIDGRTVAMPGGGYPNGNYYPSVGKEWIARVGEETSIGNIYLPLIRQGTLQPVNPNGVTVVTFPAEVLAENPDLEGVSLTVPANALFSENGNRGGRLGIAPVAPDRLPSPLPAGLDFPLVITVQTDGPANLDQPVPVCFPNLPDRATGRLKGPGEKSALWSFNHDIGDWEVVGPMTVSADGKFVCSDPGVGILQPGWHGEANGCNVTGGDTVAGGSSDGDQECPNCQPADNSDPVYLFSGEYYEAATDMRIKGRGMDFAWTRSYRSKLGELSAIGFGWQHNFDIWVEIQGEELVFHNGQNRADRFKRRSDGNYGAPGYFRVFTRNADQTFSYTLEDRSVWQFRAVNGAPGSGRLASLTDRHGNAVRLEYDPAGRLSRITDTLDRPITVAYNDGGLISSVTDFSGRTVRYSYYGADENGGGIGDLKSVTSPAIVGTPNGNDFPDGKTTTYTYSKGFADGRLNHNLLTISFPRQNDPGDPAFGRGPYLVNYYAPVQAAGDPMFDRVVRQVLGTGVLDYVYNPILPSAANGMAVMQTVMHDRAGNVHEYYYDAGNRMVRERAYTGRADPERPVTATGNRPANKLRAGDPDYFETRYEYNADSQASRVIHPNGNIAEFVYESDLGPNAPPRSRGNLVRQRRLAGSHLPAGDQAMLEENYRYDTFGFNYVTEKTDARGNSTRLSYDARGNLTRIEHALPGVAEDIEYNEWGQVTARVHPANAAGQRRRDEYRYYDSGPQRGYLAELTIDALNLKLTSKFEYDARGNLVRQTDAKGHDSLYFVNADDQRVRELSNEVSADQPVRYRTDYFYDANGNLSRRVTENRDETGAVAANAEFVTTYEYDLLNNLVAERREVDGARSIVTRREYDANDNLTVLRHGEAAAGRQSDNADRFLFDERNLLFRRTSGFGGPDASTTQLDYDGNGGTIRISTGLEDSLPRVRTVTYDAFGRVLEAADPMGNVIALSYDPAGNVVRKVVSGELEDQPGSAGNVRLAESAARFDALNRQVEMRQSFFDPATQQPLRSGRAVTARAYAPNSQLLTTRNPNGHESAFAYDSANRLARVTDGAGNSMSWTLDANGNRAEETAIEQTVGGAAQTFVSRFAYDNLNRLGSASDPAGNTTRFRYDSRGNRVAVIDARGNVTRQEYDGLNRLTANTVILTDTGDGSGAQSGAIRTGYVWDDSSRVTAQSDGNGNVTGNRYDGLGRIVEVRFADGSARAIRHDAHGNAVAMRDANGTETTMAYDLLNRIVRSEFQPAPGVSGDLTFEAFRYDGLSRITRAENDAAAVRRAYDSLYNIVAESIGDRTSSLAYDEAGNLISARYPGGRTIGYGFDEIDRLETISDETGPLAGYRYAGPSRAIRRTLRNGTVTAHAYDSARRMVNTRYLLGQANNQELLRDERSYTWNEVYRKTRVGSADGAARQYRYDSANRLVGSFGNAPGPAETVAYSFDAGGNRVRVEGGNFAGDYSMEAALPEPGDRAVNQYSRTPFDTRRYDLEGNLAGVEGPNIAPTALSYDARDRLAMVTTAQGSVRYRYDAFGRRIRKEVQTGGQTRATAFLYAGGWQAVEEQNAAGATEATFVFGRYVDEPVAMRRQGLNYYYAQDQTYNVLSLSDESGAVVESYTYSDYGVPEVRTAQGIAASSTQGNPYLFKGGYFDAETGWLHLRTRYLDPEAGRFITRDSIGMWGDPDNHGNGYTFAGNDPVNMVDPYGRDPDDVPVIDGGPAADVTNDILNLLQLPGEALEGSSAAAPAAQCSLDRARSIILNFQLDDAGRMIARDPEALLRLSAYDAQLLRNAEEAAARASRLAALEGPMSGLNKAAVGVGTVLSGVQEYRTSKAYSSNPGTRAAGTALVAGINTATSLNPVTSIMGMVDSTMTHAHSLIKTEAYTHAPGLASYVVPDKPPKVMEIMNNAGRGVVAGIDALTAWDMRRLQPFVNDVKNNQGSVSGALAWVGENVYGEIGGFFWSLPGQYDEWQLEKKRQALLAKRRGSPCPISMGGIAPVSTR